MLDDERRQLKRRADAGDKLAAVALDRDERRRDPVGWQAKKELRLQKRRKELISRYMNKGDIWRCGVYSAFGSPPIDIFYHNGCLVQAPARVTPEFIVLKAFKKIIAFRSLPENPDWIEWRDPEFFAPFSCISQGKHDHRNTCWMIDGRPRMVANVTNYEQFVRFHVAVLKKSLEFRPRLSKRI